MPVPVPVPQSLIGAEAVIDHPYPEQVSAWLGVVGEPFAAVPVRFDSTVELVRSRRHDRFERAYGCGSLAIDLSSWAGWMDGSRDWYLRLEDRSGRGGYLRHFAIRTPSGVYAVRNVPAWFGHGRRIEARVRPVAGGYASEPYVAPVNAYAAVQRRLPRQVYTGQRVTFEYVLNLPSGTPERLELVEALPRNWRVLRAEPAPRLVDPDRQEVVWDVGRLANGQRLLLEVEVPRVKGWQAFRGSYRLDGGVTAGVGGVDRLWVGDSYGAVFAP